MPENTSEARHPLDRQNAIERAIQLEGSKDPDNFKMPDGRTLTEVRQSNDEIHRKEFQEDSRMIARRTREMSIPEFTKGKDLVVTKAGNIVDVTTPPPIEENVTLAKSRTTAAEIDEGIIAPPREGPTHKATGGSGSANPGIGAVTGSVPSSAGPATSPGTTSSTPSSSGSKGGTT